ncbi:FecR/PupR family sigma factor regulator [Steroidobacter flavus]|uniref:FecR/PupR family sigma factor regulator n=1 Tax=Steroidobacter flavus TaxID=1842136 RepID=A0ABV8T1N7_9GAMM
MPDRPQKRKSKSSGRSKSISEQAADWLVALRAEDVTEEQKLGYVRWLKQSPKHIREVLELVTLEQLLKDTRVGGIELPPEPDIPADATNVVALPPVPPREEDEDDEEDDAAADHCKTPMIDTKG